LTDGKLQIAGLLWFKGETKEFCRIGFSKEFFLSWACLDQSFFKEILEEYFPEERNPVDAFGMKESQDPFQKKGNV